jgi:RimJ/RimL family protein N-acetyltransferase
VDERKRWVVRFANAEDLDKVFELANAVVGEDKWLGAQPPLDRATTFARWTSDLQDPDAARFLVEGGGRIVGSASVHLEGGRADLGLQVAELHRGQGVGSALMQAIVGWAQAREAHKITLQVWPHNHGARRLYERFGFVAEGRLQRHYRRRNGELWDAIVMGRVLDQVSPGSRFADEE